MKKFLRVIYINYQMIRNKNQSKSHIQLVVTVYLNKSITNLYWARVTRERNPDEMWWSERFSTTTTLYVLSSTSTSTSRNACEFSKWYSVLFTYVWGWTLKHFSFSFSHCWQVGRRQQRQQRQQPPRGLPHPAFPIRQVMHYWCAFDRIDFMVVRYKSLDKRWKNINWNVNMSNRMLLLVASFSFQ